MGEPEKAPIFRLKCVKTFSAAHRLHNPKLSAQENLEIYGRCNNPAGHGHNYTWKVVIRGPVDTKTGMVYNLYDLVQEMDQVLKIVDHKHLDIDVDYFR